MKAKTQKHTYLEDIEKLQKDEEQEYQKQQKARQQRKAQQQSSRSSRRRQAASCSPARAASGIGRKIPYAALRKKRQAIIRGGLIGLASVLLLLLILFSAARILNPVVRKITVEAGSVALQPSDFLKNPDADIDIEFVTDMSEISLNHVGTWQITLNVKNRQRTSTLIIQDTVAPEATGKSVMLNLGGEMEPEELLTDIVDATDVTCVFRDEMNFTIEGTVGAVVVLTDEGGNTTEVSGRITVMVDDEAPVMDGVAHLSGYTGVPVSYTANITVTDNCDENIEAQVDTSAVNADKAGTYDIVYIAEDRAGNITTEETTVTITVKPDNYVEEDIVLEMAQEILDEIITDDMTLKDKAREIYDWTRANLTYSDSSDKDSWTYAAYAGFTDAIGDCYTYFAVSKALLTQAGIPNIDIESADTSETSHYWSLVNVGDGWYHYDTCPTRWGGEFFLLTDQDLEEDTYVQDDRHVFDSSLYPATPTVDSTIE